MPSVAWQDLHRQQQLLVETRISDLFKQDSARFKQFSLQFNDILLDFSKQRITTAVVETLCQLAKEAELKASMTALFNGQKVNYSEQRSVLHVALRDPGASPLMVDERNIKADVHSALEQIQGFTEIVRAGQRLGATGKTVTDILSLGIGGSDLGPSMVCEALHEYRSTDLNVHFVANIDGKTLASIFKKCDPETTLCIINSKTFTTPETLQNAKAVRTWFESVLGEKGAVQHLIGVTANPEEALRFGILKENIFAFWDFVGGRYSVWSSVGLPIALMIGMDEYKSFLLGAHQMDQHFISAPFAENMPVLLGLIGIWNSNFWHCSTQAIIPYDDGLRKFPDYLQQLEMESNGKRAAKENGFVSHTTAPVIWGGVGCNGQHAYMQLLHQGTQIIPVDFILSATGHLEFDEHHELLVASCLSQSKALMEGSKEDSLNQDPLRDAKYCAGDRPSCTIMYPKLTPTVLGSLIALYEHKVFVQGIVWGINSFDQWGVELGKKMVKEILPHLQGQPTDTQFDSSTQGLIDFFQKNRV